MAQKKGIVIICNLDTRGEDIIFVKHLIESRGHKAYFLDFSMEEPPPFPGDITCEQVAERGGMTIEAVRECYRSDRDRAMKNQIKGASSIVADMMKKGKVQGVFGVGGGTSSLVGTSVMKNCPPLVFGPRFAIESMPALLCRSFGWNSSSNVKPGPPVPCPRGSPPWIMKLSMIRWKMVPL